MQKVFLIIGCLALSSCNPFANDWIEDCEDAFRYRLKSPDSYERISYKIVDDKIEIEQYLKNNPQFTIAQINDIKKRKPDFRRWFAIVEYDAVNSYNAKIRETFVCENFTETGKPPLGGLDDNIKKMYVKIDGKTGYDLQMEAFKEQLEKMDSAKNSAN